MKKKQPDSVAHLISLMFMIGRSMRDGAHKKRGKGKFASMLQFETLRFARDERPLMSDVARHFSITPPAATLLINGLVKEKLLTRVVDTKDRRAVRIVLTKQGKALLARGINERVARLKKIFGNLTGPERASLISILTKMAKTAEGLR